MPEVDKLQRNRLGSLVLWAEMPSMGRSLLARLQGPPPTPTRFQAVGRPVWLSEQWNKEPRRSCRNLFDRDCCR